MTGPDNQFDEFLRDAAKGYNQPKGVAPRDAMWTSIVQERRRRAAANAQRRIQFRWVAGIAAVLVMGVAIGRLTAPKVQDAPTTLAVGGNDMSYQTAAAEYLGRVETLLTLFRMQARAGNKPDQVTTTNARSLLSTGRMLLDSPAGTDPRTKHLLEDLDLVLAQIAQLAAEKGMDPTSFILQALDDKGVLFRLRAAVPAASPTSAQGAL